MQEIIEQCRGLAGEPPRKAGFWIWWRHVRVTPPAWVSRHPKEPLNAIYRQQKDIWQRGRVVWGRIIQANGDLFVPGNEDLPAEAIYSFDPAFDAGGPLLDSIAHRLFNCKGSKMEDPRLTEIGRVLADELERTPRREIPKECTSGRVVFWSTILVVRRHLPNAWLSRGLFPLLACEDWPFAMILSSRFWPTELVNWWKQG